jgi:uncharacterized protein YpiB (UPF0302 family)
MNGKVTLDEKKEFIEWFVGQNKYQGTNGQKLLKLLLKNVQLIENVNFIEKNDGYSKFIKVSSFVGVVEPMFYTDEIDTFTTDVPAQMFKKIQKNKEEPLYIQLDFKDKDGCWEYLSVKEIEMYDPTEGNIVEQAELLLKRFNMLSKIDDCLDRKDKKLFNELVTKSEK